VACVIFTGAGERAFCVGGDQKEYVEQGSYGTSENGLWELEELQQTLRNIPKPVIAAVNGFAIGGGHVPQAQLLDEAKAWGREAAALSPTAIRFLKASFNADSDAIFGQGRLAFAGLDAFAGSEKAHEGHTAFSEKRAPDFSKFR
jgi:1,4-dihydroxy-2-naphthoyl-CoA synthase